MVLIRHITDSDVLFENSGRIVIRNHGRGSRGVMVIKRDTCGYCVKATEKWNTLASKYSDPSTVYVVDMEAPECQTILGKFNPRGVPTFFKVNGAGRIDNAEEFSFDWNDEQTFLNSIKR